MAKTKTALVTAASGLGDVLRVTPLIRVCARNSVIKWM